MTSPSSSWEIFLESVRGLPTFDRPALPSAASVEWALWPPWHALRLPEDAGSMLGPEVPEDHPQRILAWEHAQMDIRRLKPHVAAAWPKAVAATAPTPGLIPEGQWARAFAACGFFTAYSRVDVLGEIHGCVALVFLFARTGESLLATISTETADARALAVTSLYDVAAAGPRTAVPDARAGPRLAVRFHSHYGSGTRFARMLQQPLPRDPANFETEIETFRREHSVDKLSTSYWWPKDVSPELLRDYETELDEYLDDLRFFRQAESEESDRGSRTMGFTLVVENAGDAAARDVVVQLTFPPSVVVGTSDVNALARVRQPDRPRLLDPPNLGQHRRQRLQRTLDVDVLDATARELRWESYESRPDGSVVARRRFPEINAGAMPNLAQVVITFRDWDAVGPVTIACDITAANLSSQHVDITVDARRLSPEHNS